MAYFYRLTSYTKAYTFMTPGRKELRVAHHVAISIAAQQDHDLTVQLVVGSTHQHSGTVLFCASGIYPFNKQKVFDRLPKEDNGEQEIESTLTNFLRESRYESTSNQPARKRRRLDVAPGKSCATRDETTQSADQQNNNQRDDIATSDDHVTSQVEASSVDNAEIPERQMNDSDPDENFSG
ncbi:unnamed protein product [Euphydryas editha]|uniref:Uncharacterized protein n=1 Tax=Euphydryas editha TaxID=104508 RepID=A0AAU9TLY6_EUPED|nr:unnamed protein product [Euphydryas editha]